LSGRVGDSEDCASDGIEGSSIFRMMALGTIHQSTADESRPGAHRCTVEHPKKCHSCHGNEML
jgi:hypothetical protein